MLNSTDPDIRRLLGVEGDMGKALGVDNKWAYNVIKQVGNFGEMWDRNITPMGVPRGHQQHMDQGRPAIRAADTLRPSGRPAGMSGRTGVVLLVGFVLPDCRTVASRRWPRTACRGAMC